MEILKDAILDSLIDGVKLLPFLFLTYLLMEFLEHRASKKTEHLVKRSGKWGPLFGGILGAVPQCGFSAAGSNLYAGRVITVGTLMAIYLSTSDEMLPIMISQQAPVTLILKILGIKVLIGVLAGFLTDLVYHRFFEKAVHITPATEEHHIVELCEHEHCNCSDENIFLSALKHTLQVFLYLFAVTLLVNLLILWVGEDRITLFLSGKDVFGILIAGIVGLIPNCAASVVLTQLYLEGMLSFSAMIAGLLVGAGVGLLVLFRMNGNWKENITITTVLYLIGIASGLILSLFPF